MAAIFGTSILRDFQRDTYQLIFTKPIGKLAYLGGRWAGSLFITLLVFTGIPIGEVLGAILSLGRPHPPGAHRSGHARLSLRGDHRA